MTSEESVLIHQALEVLNRLVRDGEPWTSRPTPRPQPVEIFARNYLSPDPADDLTTAELWQFYREIVAAGELEPLTKQAFLRALPDVMAMVFGARKCHSIKRDGKSVRGFKSVTIREENLSGTATIRFA